MESGVGVGVGGVGSAYLAMIAAAYTSTTELGQRADALALGGEAWAGEPGRAYVPMTYCAHSEADGWPLLTVRRGAPAVDPGVSDDRSFAMHVEVPVYFDMLWDAAVYRATELPNLMAQFRASCADVKAQGPPFADGWGTEACAVDLGEQFMAWAAWACGPPAFAPNEPGNDVCVGPVPQEVADPRLPGKPAGPGVAPQWSRLLEKFVLPQRAGAQWGSYYPLVSRFLADHFRQLDDLEDDAAADHDHDDDDAVDDDNSDEATRQRGHRGAPVAGEPPPRPRVVVELGTAFGGLGDRLLGDLRAVTLFAVDPLEPGYDSGDAHSRHLCTLAAALFPGDGNHGDGHKDEVGLSSEPSPERTPSSPSSSSSSREASGGGGGCGGVAGRGAAKQLAEAWASGLVADQRARHGCRYHLLRLASVAASRSFADRSVDAVFVDGLHTYAGVSA
jgi:hypothetical protein